MTKETVKLIDPSGALVAVAVVADEGPSYSGTVDLTRTPAEVRALFDEFDEIVNGQMFHFLDEIEGKIAGLGIRAVFENGREVPVRHLQVHSSSGELCFKLAELATPGTDSASPGTQETSPTRKHAVVLPGESNEEISRKGDQRQPSAERE
jgi:hypothetical protein